MQSLKHFVSLKREIMPIKANYILVLVAIEDVIFRIIDLTSVWEPKRNVLPKSITP